MANITLSKKFTLQGGDFLRGLGMAIATPVLVAVQRLIEAGKVDFSWKALLMMGIGGGVAYLLKNLVLEPATVKVTTDTNQKAVNAEKNIKENITK